MELDGSGNRRRAYTHYPGIDQPHSVREFTGNHAGRYYFAMELPGHVTGLLNASGARVNRYGYSAFGKLEQFSETIPNPLRYMAREWDPVAGLYYVRNRWYDPEVGRFISEDPIGLAGGINVYVYAGNDPINARDPYGLEECKIYYRYDWKIVGSTVVISNLIFHPVGECGAWGGGGSGAPPSDTKVPSIGRCPSDALEWPLDRGRMSSSFNPRRRHPTSGVVRPHNGMDIAAPIGTPVFPIHHGEVVEVGHTPGPGNQVQVRHYGGWLTRYMHLNSISVSKGSFVTPWTQIGTVGNTGISTGPHLHLEIRLPDGTAIDPQQCF